MARGLESILADRRVLDWGKSILTLQPEKYPLLVATKKLAKEDADNMKYISFEDRPYTRWFYVGTVTGSSPITGLKLEVVENDTDYDGAAAYINVGDILHCPDQDNSMRVTAVNTTTGEITVTSLYAGQGEGGTDGRIENSSDTTSDTHSDPADGNQIVKLSTAFPDGGVSATTHALDLAEVYNFIQKFQTAYDVDEEIMLAALKGKPEIERLMARKAIEHAKDIESHLLLGDRDARLLSSKWIRTTAGIFHSGIAVDTSTQANFTEAVWLDFVEAAFTNDEGGSGEKLCIAGSLIASKLARWMLGRLTINDELSAKLGMKVVGTVTPFGIVDFIWHPLLKKYFQGWACILDMNYLRYKQFGPDTQLSTGIQANNAQERLDEYLTRCGLKLGLIEAHRILKVT